MSLREYRTAVADNRRWERFSHRPGDIFVCTPPKCGTTWTQTIVASLLWPEGPAPGPVMTVAPWLDAQFYPLDEILARLDAQTHRRSIKTHTPADGIPIFDDARYLFVARDGRDAFMSLCHHYEVFKNDVRATLNERAAADGVPPMPGWNGDYHAFFQRWLQDASLLHHVATFWELRKRSNLLFVHFSDLKRELAGEMRRIAAFLELDVPESRWPAVVERCTFDAMRARPDEIGTFAVFEGGAKSFLFKGTSGRWRDVLDAAELEAYEKRVAQVLPADAAAWLENGRGADAVRG
ncbi:MAG TPA: sulfotransferase domain-containing protein [Myxococcota bacterium]|nr:sulfotransferase domain-containing protein [Myxococcota bacterium]